LLSAHDFVGWAVSGISWDRKDVFAVSLN